MIRIGLTFVIGVIAFAGLAQEKKSKDFLDKKIEVAIKLKAPGMFSKVETGNILILKLKNTNPTPRSVSFKILEYADGVIKSETEKLSNCIKKRKKIKVHLENFGATDSYDWVFSDVSISFADICPKK